MITIKFRGQRLDNKKWEYGDLMHDNCGGCYVFPIDAEGLYREYEVAPDTVGQFTTLRDKNGKEIYAGDILRAGEEKTLLEVRFVRGVFAFLWNGDLDDEFPCNAPTQEWAEVVGNIHDNPEMIKRK